MQKETKIYNMKERRQEKTCTSESLTIRDILTTADEAVFCFDSLRPESPVTIPTLKNTERERYRFPAILIVCEGAAAAFVSFRIC